MQKILKYGRFLTALMVAILAVSAFVGAFYPIRIFDLQFGALTQRLWIDVSLVALGLFVLLILLTLIFGRIYCSMLCPFGILQEFLMIIFHRRNRIRRNLPYKYFLSAFIFGSLFGGTAVFLRLIDPYALFSSFVGGTLIGVGCVLAVAVLIWFKGRWFCSNICPIGAVLGVLSRFSLFKIRINRSQCSSCGVCARACPMGCIDFKNKAVDNEMCVNCFKCLGRCRRHALQYVFSGSEKSYEKQPFSPSRRRFLIGGLTLAVFVSASRYGLMLGKNIVSKVREVLLPAGAQSSEKFSERCLNCNLCVQHCPMKIIKKADKDYPAVHLNYGKKFCKFGCHRCSEVCPSGAIRKIDLATKQKTKIGTALIDYALCVRCGSCARECPKQIIDFNFSGGPIVRTDLCIGCGKCRSVCPVQAIRIEPVDEQKILDD